MQVGDITYIPTWEGWLTALGVGTVVPHESTLRRVLQKVDPVAVEAALRSWVLTQLDAQPRAAWRW
ncbi:transposase family protein [Pseudonocardia nigra]|uniref:transposase family protein n=1 Tax=Pseudonocardia nigra TaxID=1921578 RepID=UPI001C5E2F05|nr:transposase family protein [Pseudonocardia nigra]